MDQQDSAAPDTPDTKALEAAIIEALQSVYDPEIPVSIYDLGLIYDIAIGGEAPGGEAPGDSGANVAITMTLTAPGCPVADILPIEIEEKVRAVPGVATARIEITWDPPWNPDMMSEAARLELGMF